MGQVVPFLSIFSSGNRRHLQLLNQMGTKREPGIKTPQASTAIHGTILKLGGARDRLPVNQRLEASVQAGGF